MKDHAQNPAFLNHYLQYQSVFKGRSDYCIAETQRALREYCQYFHYYLFTGEFPKRYDDHKDMDISKMSLTEITSIMPKNIEQYLVFLEQSNAPITIRKKTSLLRCFYTYLEKNADALGIQFPRENPMAKVVAPPAKRTMPRVLTSHQIDCLLNSVSGETAHRDRTMFLLMVTAGLTMADLTGINRKDILSDRRIRIRGREGTQNRIIYLTAATEQSLQAYLSILDDADYRDSLHPYSPLFVSSVGKHGRLTPVMIRKRLTAAAKAAGIPDLSPTDLRDTAAAMLLKSNAERQDVFLYLGYRTPNAGGRFDHLVHKRCSEQSAMKEAIDASGLAHIGEGNYE